MEAFLPFHFFPFSVERKEFSSLGPVEDLFSIFSPSMKSKSLLKEFHRPGKETGSQKVTSL